MTVTKYLLDRPQDYLIMTRQQVRDFDAWAINEMNIPGVVLMENAGRGCAEVIVDQLAPDDNSKICIFCGTGNNGGDGCVIARHLANHGIDARTVICSDPQKVEGDARTNLDIIRSMNLPVHTLDISAAHLPERISDFTNGCALVVDAIFGTGLTGELRGNYARLIACLNAQRAPIIAVDIPSGLDCDTGLPLPVSIEAQTTVTFVAVKKGFVACPESAAATGRIYIASIGIEPR